MSGNSDESYEVGYGKPPKATRFKKAKSGNPSGRPRKPAQPFDPGLILEVIENEEMVVLENGKRKPMKKVEIQFRLHFAVLTGSSPMPSWTILLLKYTKNA